jgi:hypothetical protein
MILKRNREIVLRVSLSDSGDAVRWRRLFDIRSVPQTTFQLEASTAAAEAVLFTNITAGINTCSTL